jgi:predicted nucleic acid-binding protein
MPSIIIADTSCFILLHKIGEIELLKSVYSNVYTTPEVAYEFVKPLPSWTRIESVKNTAVFKELEKELDKGEASAIALSYQIEGAIIVLDDLMARKVAERLSVAYTGTFGVIAKAKVMGVIPSVKPILERIKQTNFRFSESVYTATLLAAEEL